MHVPSRGRQGNSACLFQLVLQTSLFSRPAECWVFYIFVLFPGDFAFLMVQAQWECCLGSQIQEAGL